MTIVVLLLLLLIWAVVLGPSLWRREMERRSIDSIGAFHRQLRVLQRAGPSLVDPVHRLDARLPSAHVAHRVEEDSRPGLIVVRPDSAVPAAPGNSRLSSRRRPDPFFRYEACKRRQSVLLSLLSTVVFTGIVGTIPAARISLAVTAVTALALVGYVVLLVRLRNRAREREHKLRYLPEPVDPESCAPVRQVAVR